MQNDNPYPNKPDRPCPLNGRFVLTCLVILALLSGLAVVQGCGPTGRPTQGDSQQTSSTEEDSPAAEETETNIISRQDAISEHWDDIRQFMDGTETVQARSVESGSTYTLNADISGGELETLHFSEGGLIHFRVTQDFDDGGSASGPDEDGYYWFVDIDMDSRIVDDAIKEWADNNNYIVE